MAYTPEQLEQINNYVSEKKHSVIQNWLTEQEYNSGEYFISPTGSFETDKTNAGQETVNFNYLSQIACESINQISNNVIAKYGGILEPITLNTDGTYTGIYANGTVGYLKRATGMFIYNLLKVGEEVLAFNRVDQSINLNDGTSINTGAIDYQNLTEQVAPIVKKIVLNSGILSYKNSTIFGIQETYSKAFLIENFVSEQRLQDALEEYDGDTSVDFIDENGIKTEELQTLTLDTEGAYNIDNTTDGDGAGGNLDTTNFVSTQDIDQDVFGVKDFKTGLKKNGVDVATINQLGNHRTDQEINDLIDAKLVDYVSLTVFEQYQLNQLAINNQQDQDIYDLGQGGTITAPDGTQITMNGTDISIEVNNGAIVLEYDRDIVQSNAPSANLLFSDVSTEDGDVLVLVGDNTTGYIRYLNMVINGNSTTFGKNDYLFATPRPDYSTMLEVKARDVVVDNDGTTESKYCGVIVMNKTAIKDISLKLSQYNGTDNGSGVLSNATIKVYKQKTSNFKKVMGIDNGKK